MSIPKKKFLTSVCYNTFFFKKCFFYSFTYFSQRVILGEFPIQSFGVEKIIVHERFNFNPPIHDIGLVKVDRDISFSGKY